MLKFLQNRCDFAFNIITFHRIIQGLNLKRKNVSLLTNELIIDVQESIERGGEIEVIAILGNILSRKVNCTLLIQLDWR